MPSHVTRKDDDEVRIRPNLRCYFKKSINKFKSPLLIMANAFKSTFNLKNVRTLATNSWDILNNTIIENDEIDSSDDYMEIYTKLLLELQNCENIEQTNYFIQRESIDTARYHAGNLWNFQLICEAEENDRIEEFFKQSTTMTIIKMNAQDLITINKLIMHDCKDSFPDLKIDLNPSQLTIYLLEKIMDKELLDVFVRLINLWFLKTPLLNEIAKHVTWNFLNETNACLLTVSDLYEIFINQCYRN